MRALLPCPGVLTNGVGDAPIWWRKGPTRSGCSCPAAWRAGGPAATRAGEPGPPLHPCRAPAADSSCWCATALRLW